jgi:hypothetical protein
VGDGVARYPSTQSRLAPHVAHSAVLPGGMPSAGDGGLMIGRDRHRDPVVLRLLRPEHTRAVLVGGLACAQMLIFRAVAIGARVCVQTLRPQAWEGFPQRTGIGAAQLAFAAPGARLPASADAAHPELIVLDVGALNWNAVDTACGWRASVVVRHEVAAVDADLLGNADLAVLQPLTGPEAAIAAPALGIPQTEPWLSRISVPMVAVASQGTVRWATLDPTEAELRTIGQPNRVP